MSYDVVCVGRPFLDLVLTGLPRLPEPGTEVVGEALHVAAGGIANTALGLGRLGLSTALLGPRGEDFAGLELARLLRDAGIEWLGPAAGRAAVSVVLPIGDERTMLTFDPGGGAPPPDALEALAPRAVVGDHPFLTAPGARRFVGAGYEEAVAARRNAAAVVGSGDTLIVNDLEARILTDADDPAEACRRLAALVETAVVTDGRRGAMACSGGVLERCAAPAVTAVDTLGAGDLFMAAYIWADLGGLPLARRLAWAVLYASLSVRVPTTLAGALARRELVEEGARHGLVPPDDRREPARPALRVEGEGNEPRTTA